MKKRLLSLVLVLCFMFSMSGVALANTETAETDIKDDSVYGSVGNELTLLRNAYGYSYYRNGISLASTYASGNTRVRLWVFLYAEDGSGLVDNGEAWVTGNTVYSEGVKSEARYAGMVGESMATGYFSHFNTWVNTDILPR